MTHNLSNDTSLSSTDYFLAGANDESPSFCITGQPPYSSSTDPKLYEPKPDFMKDDSASQTRRFLLQFRPQAHTTMQHSDDSVFWSEKLSVQAGTSENLITKLNEFTTRQNMNINSFQKHRPLSDLMGPLTPLKDNSKEFIFETQEPQPSMGVSSSQPENSTISKIISEEEKKSLAYYYENKKFEQQEIFNLIKNSFKTTEQKEDLLKSINSIQILLSQGFISHKAIDTIKNKLFLSINNEVTQAQINEFVDYVVQLARFRPRKYFSYPDRTTSIKKLFNFFNLDKKNKEILNRIESINNSNQLTIFTD